MRSFGEVPPLNNDDWYWLYLGVAGGENTWIVTNDEMRDHHFTMLSEGVFQHWRERHQCYFELGSGTSYAGGDDRRVVLRPPPPHSVRTQAVFGKEGEICGWHIPCNGGPKLGNRTTLTGATIDEQMRPDVGWLCVKRW